MKELPHCIQWSEEVLSIIDGIRNGDTRVLFKVTNITHKRTKSSHVVIRKKRERCMTPESLLIPGGGVTLEIKEQCVRVSLKNQGQASERLSPGPRTGDEQLSHLVICNCVDT